MNEALAVLLWYFMGVIAGAVIALAVLFWSSEFRSSDKLP
jgi:hypothetical protein